MFSGCAHFQTVDRYVNDVHNLKSYPFTVVSDVIKCVLLGAFKNIVINSGNQIGDGFRSSVYRLAEKTLKANTKLIQEGRREEGPMKDWVVHVVKVMCTATDLLVWSVCDVKGKIVTCP